MFSDHREFIYIYIYIVGTYVFYQKARRHIPEYRSPNILNWIVAFIFRMQAIFHFVQKCRHIYRDKTTSNNAVNQVQVKLQQIKAFLYMSVSLWMAAARHTVRLN